MRDAVIDLLALGQMPSEINADDGAVERYQAAIDALEAPASDQEATALLVVLPDSEASLFGLAWTVFHFIETAPSGPDPALLDHRNPWVAELRRRAGGGYAASCESRVRKRHFGVIIRVWLRVHGRGRACQSGWCSDF